MKASPRPTQFAICVKNRGYPASLELHKVYRVLPDDDAKSDGDLRVVDESGEDYLYPSNYFVVVDLPRDTAKTLKRSLTRR
jgi:hypothetical protein